MPPSVRRLAGFVSARAEAPPPSPLEQRLLELEERIQSVVNVYQVNSDLELLNRGTGFLRSADGQVVTNAHVVNKPDAKTLVTFAGGNLLEAEPIFVDTFLDLAIRDLPGSGYPFLRFAREKPAAGSPVVAIGNASGYSNSVTFGIVSGTDRPSPYHAVVHYPSIQIDAPINHGNSGGPILNPAGEVVAVAAWTEGKEETEGIAFGIPASGHGGAGPVGSGAGHRPALAGHLCPGAVLGTGRAAE